MAPVDELRSPPCSSGVNFSSRHAAPFALLLPMASPPPHVAPSDEVQDLKAKLKDLIAQREALELEVASITARLNAPGMPGLTGGLLDKEVKKDKHAHHDACDLCSALHGPMPTLAAFPGQGYPRSDIDIPAVRTDRQRLACLSNDHKGLTDRIEGLLAKLHAAARCVHAPCDPCIEAPLWDLNPGYAFDAHAAGLPRRLIR